MNPNFFHVLTLCTLPAITSSKYLLVQIAENGGKELRSNPASHEKNLTLTIDEESMHIESRGDNKPINCRWGKWKDWSPCSESCGKGFWEKTRAKEVVESAGGTCSGGEKETQPCQIRTNVCEPLPGHVGSTYLVVTEKGVVGSYVDIEMAKEKMKGIKDGQRLIAEVNSENILQRTWTDVHYDVGGQHQTKSQGFNNFWWNWPEIVKLMNIAQKYLDNKSSE